MLIDPKYDVYNLAGGVELPGAPKGIDRFVISPGNRLIAGFDCIIAVCVLTTAIVTPLEVAYRKLVLGQGLDIAIDVLFLVDMALQSVHSYLEGGYPVLSLRRVALRYARSWLLIDLVAVLPWEFIARQHCRNSVSEAPQLAPPAAPLPCETASFGSLPFSHPSGGSAVSRSAPSGMRAPAWPQRPSLRLLPTPRLAQPSPSSR